MNRYDDIGPAAPHLRDGKVVTTVQTTRDLVGGLHTALDNQADEAFGEEAFAHACLYSAVAAYLAIAEKALNDASEVLAGDL